MPKISVIMPVYNVADFVGVAIDSILSQSFTDLELLIMDDGSTDDTLAKIKLAQLKDSRTRIFERPNRKVATCLNELVKLSHGDIIARMDGDDIAHPDRLQKQLNYLENNPNTAVVGSWVKTFGDRNEVWHFRQWDNFSRNLLFFGVTILSHPTWMLKKALLETYPYDDSFRTIIDREWLARVAVREPSLKFVSLPEVLLDYRVHDGSVTGQFLQRQIELTGPVVQYYLKQFGVELSPAELTLYLACCLNQKVEPSAVAKVGEIVTQVRDTVASHINDEFHVFREKWVQFCEINNATSLLNKYVEDNDVVFIRERKMTDTK